jgi:DNA-binding XRE family transcriptional regulator
VSFLPRKATREEQQERAREKFVGARNALAAARRQLAEAKTSSPGTLWQIERERDVHWLQGAADEAEQAAALLGVDVTAC